MSSSPLPHVTQLALTHSEYNVLSAALGIVIAGLQENAEAVEEGIRLLQSIRNGAQFFRTADPLESLLRKTCQGLELQAESSKRAAEKALADLSPSDRHAAEVLAEILERIL